MTNAVWDELAARSYWRTSRLCFPRKGVNVPICKEIQIGGIAASNLIEQLLRRYSIDQWVIEIMCSDAFSTLPATEQVQLVLLTPSELGCTAPPWEDDLFYGDVLDRWSEANLNGHRLTLCPAEIGPHLRLQYDEQPRAGKPIWIAMARLPDSAGLRRAFCLWRTGIRRRTCTLQTTWRLPGGTRWQLSTPLVFRLAKLEDLRY